MQKITRIAIMGLLFFSWHTIVNANTEICLNTLYNSNSTTNQSENLTAKREALIVTLRQKGVTDTRVIEAFKSVPRENFVTPGFMAEAYTDKPLPIGCGQTISQPSLVANMTQTLLHYRHMQKILEIGTGSGFQAAILAHLVPEVYSIERIKALSLQAQKNLQKSGVYNVALRYGDGFQGWPEHAPYDGIILTAAAGEMPLTLIKQLRDGGVLLMPIKANGHQVMQLIVRHGNHYSSETVGNVAFVPLIRGSLY